MAVSATRFESWVPGNESLVLDSVCLVATTDRYAHSCAAERFGSLEITQRLVSQALGTKDESKDPIDLLTDRELEIFRMIGQGKTSGAIADDLFLSSHTIDTHRENIKRKLGLKNASELNRQAVQFLLENC